MSTNKKLFLKNLRNTLILGIVFYVVTRGILALPIFNNLEMRVYYKEIDRLCKNFVDLCDPIDFRTWKSNLEDKIIMFTLPAVAILSYFITRPQPQFTSKKRQIFFSILWIFCNYFTALIIILTILIIQNFFYYGLPDMRGL